MNERAQLRRGACPGLSAPMQTGDGLLARLAPSGATISLDQFDGLCVAARRHGNGIVEVTSRGSIQVRGLSAASAPLFAVDVAALAIEPSDGVPVLSDPLSDDHVFAAEIRAALAQLATKLSAKVSVVVDLDLDADISLRTDRDAVHVALASSPLGAVPRGQAADAVRQLLAALSPGMRMREALAQGGIAPFKTAIADIVSDVPPPVFRSAVDRVGTHRVSSGVALGIGLPFGHSDAATLLKLTGAARQARASGVRTAPGRALLVMGLPDEAVAAVATAATTLGFITDREDWRRRVIACAGAPICASGEIPARALAPTLAHAARHLRPQEIIHISGCIKGCAHPSPATVTVTGQAGRCDIAVDGTASGSVTAAVLPQRLATLLRRRGGHS